MNISPTPRRYTSRGRSGDFNNENYFAFSDPINNKNANSSNGLGRERIVPEEYKLNSQMINRLIRQNKELMNKLDSKQQEIDRLNVLVGSLRGKLIKYTELNRKLEERQNNHENSASRRQSDVSDNFEVASNYIQLPKRRNDKDLEKDNEAKYSKDDRINALSEKLDKLTKLMIDSRNGSLGSPTPQLQSINAPTPVTAPMSATSITSPPPPASSSTVNWQRPSEEDIMCRESTELKQLENQIESLKRKLLIKRENELRKISLSQELLELMGKLNMEQQQNVTPNDATTISSNPGTSKMSTTAVASNPSTNQQVPSSSPEYCMECHHSKAYPRHEHHQHRHPANIRLNDINSSKLAVPTLNPLDTPTPFVKRTSIATSSTGDLSDTMNKVW